MIAPKRHPDSLIPSLPDDVELLIAVVDRYNDLIVQWKRNKKTALLVPSHMESSKQLVIRLKERYSKRDFRHNLSEKTALREFAQWTLLVKAAMCNQDPKIIDWGD